MSTWSMKGRIFESFSGTTGVKSLMSTASKARLLFQGRAVRAGQGNLFSHWARFSIPHLCFSGATSSDLGLLGLPQGRLWCAVPSCSVVSHSVRPRGLQPARLLCPWDSPGKSTGVGCHALLQGLFPTQGWNPRLLSLEWQAGSLPPQKLPHP